MRSVRLGVVLLLSACSGADPSDLESQVVSLYVTHQRYDDDRPWAKSNPMGRAAFATVVEGPALLTLAQMVSDSTQHVTNALGSVSGKGLFDKPTSGFGRRAAHRGRARGSLEPGPLG